MKKIEDLEKLTPADWERIGLNTDVEIPHSLEERLKEVLVAEQILEAGECVASPLRTRLGVGLSVLAAASVVAAVFLSRTPAGTLKDTFDDPHLAYAEVERTFSRISEKMGAGSGKAYKATEMLEKTNDIIRKINRK